MSDDLVASHSHPVPRYTSYPTAPHFHTGIDPQTYAGWLRAIDPAEPISLYLHIPFCDRLCWFCACHTKQVLRYEPIAAYLDALQAEITTVASHIGRAQPVSAIHFGGGSPTMVAPADLARLRQHLDRHFVLSRDCEISVEVDPNDISQERLDAWAAFGVTRASFGVQDFDPLVQQTINRHQSFEQTAAAVDGFRQRGVRSVNLDVLYGLPHQTEATLRATLDQVASLEPDRIALFGYAHVPWMKKHQSMIDAAALPDLHARFAQAQLGARHLVGKGYMPVGIDHFALPDDKLAREARRGTLRRNFQGYTTDQAQTLLGLGASAIGGLPRGYVQAVTPTHDYIRRALAGELPVARGYALTEDDRARRWIIESLMCRFAFSAGELRGAFPTEARALLGEALVHAATDKDGLTRFDGDRFIITPRGRPFTRTIAAQFDAYLENGKARHSVAV